MLRVVTFKWRPAAGYHTTFTAEHVNVLARMVARFYAPAHEFICITDDAEGLSPDVRVIPLWPDHAELPNPNGPNFPSCYRRLKAFSAEMEALIGARFVMLDLDSVITGDLAPLWDRPGDFIILRNSHPKLLYSGAMVLMDAGARRDVWDRFDPAASPVQARAMGHFGSDQAWISAWLGEGEKTWSTEDGAYSFHHHLMPMRGALPENARIVNFHGAVKPWDERIFNALPWVRTYWT